MKNFIVLYGPKPEPKEQPKPAPKKVRRKKTED